MLNLQRLYVICFASLVLFSACKNSEAPKMAAGDGAEQAALKTEDYFVKKTKCAEYIPRLEKTFKNENEESLGFLNSGLTHETQQYILDEVCFSISHNSCVAFVITLDKEWKRGKSNIRGERFESRDVLTNGTILSAGMNRMIEGTPHDKMASYSEYDDEKRQIKKEANCAN